MQSEVRKLLEKHPYYITGGVYEKLDVAERADAAKREEPVQALRKAVAELVARWRTVFLPTPVAKIVRDLLTELSAIIVTKPDTVENRQATASGQVQGEWPPNWVTVQKIREIAAAVVRDAIADAFRKHAETLRNMPGAGHAAAVAAVSDAIGKACEAER